MPRQSRSSARPAARPSAPSSTPGTSRSASTVAAPRPQQQQAPAQHAPQPPAAAPAPSAGSGMLGNIVSTAAGVATGHAISNALFGGSSSSSQVDQAQAAPAPAPAQAQDSFSQQNSAARCELDAKNLTQCLTATNNDASACQHYIDMLKQCQQMSSQY